MYSLICRHAKVGLIPNQEYGDGDVGHKSPDNRNPSKFKTMLENNGFGKHVLWFGKQCGLVADQESNDNRASKRSARLKSMLENSDLAKYVLLFATMLGTAMVIGDGIITPCISGTLVFFKNSIYFIVF